MSNKFALNASALNSAGASAQIRHEAEMSVTANSSSDIAIPLFNYKSSINLNSNIVSNFESGNSEQFASLNLLGISTQLTDSNINYASSINWDNTSNIQIDSIVFHNSAAISMTHTIEWVADPDVTYGDLVLIPPSAELIAEPAKVQFLKTEWNSELNFVNDSLLVTRNVITDWNIISSVFLDSHVIELGITEINYDGYTEWDGLGNWDNTPWLTAIFTTGNFYTPFGDIEIEGTRVKPSSSNWSDSKLLEIDPIYIGHGITELSNESLLESDSTKIVFSSFDKSTNSNWLNPKAKLFAVGNQDLQNDSDLEDIVGTITYAGRTSWVNNNEVEPIEAIRIKLGRSILQATGDVQEINGVRFCFGTLDLDGIGSSLSTAARLKFLDAPDYRTFEVPQDNRYFIVPATENKFGA